MLNPIIVHINNLIQVSGGRNTICNKENIAPKGATIWTSGVLNGLGISGLVILKINTAMLTIAKASNVPIDTNSPNNLIGKVAATNIANDTTIIVDIYGVFRVGWTCDKNGGNKPSRDIEKNILVWPNKVTIITEVNPANAPSLTRGFNHRIPILSIPTAIGSGTLSSL